jgi:hypothetical protein
MKCEHQGIGIIDFPNWRADGNIGVDPHRLGGRKIEGAKDCDEKRQGAHSFAQSQTHREAIVVN